MALTIHAIFRAQRVAVTTGATLVSPATLPAEYLTFELEADDGVPAEVILDKRRIPLSVVAGGKRGHFLFDAFRSVGFHCLQNGDERYYFATEDAKLKLAGILQLLHYVETSGLSWGHQVFFADGTALRDRRVDYAWLVEAGLRIGTATRAIAAMPFRRHTYEVTVEPTGTGRALVAPTLALIRREGIRALERDNRGPLRYGTSRYSPRKAVVARRRRSFDTVANRRAARLLVEAQALGRELLAADMPKDSRRALAPVVGELYECLQLHPFAQLTDETHLPDQASPEELIDERYRSTFELYEVLRHELGWRAGTKVCDEYAFVGYSDQIYQAFVASLIARAAGAKPLGPTLHPGLTGPSFQSERYDIYYDTTPPQPEFQNWRDASSRPSDMRPDVTIVDRQSRRGLLIDAKYRIDGGRAPTTALAECQVYMQSFQHNAVAVCYPGIAARMDDVTDGTYRMLEISLGPFAGVEDFVSHEVWPKLQDAMQPLYA